MTGAGCAAPDYRRYYEDCRAAVDAALAGYFTEPNAYQGLQEAMRYSLLAGGKRIRPVLVLAFCEALGGSREEALPHACAVEMLHTYSLIHDDLPCMDNDDLRRGKPTNHRAFNEWTATLAGDALQAAAFWTVLTAPNRHGPELPGLIATFLAAAAGPDGICGGQFLDILGEDMDLDERQLTEINSRKTAALLRGACCIGVLASGRADGPSIDAAAEYADNLGMAFQIRDDVLDMTATTEQLGKPAGSDAENGKTTFATLLGVEACQQRIDTYTAQAKSALRGKLADPGFLDWLADLLAGREQ